MAAEGGPDFSTAVADYLAAHPKARPAAPAPGSGRHAHRDDLADTAPGASLHVKAAEISAATGEDFPEEATSWLVGAQGEAITAEALAPLTKQGWYLINSVTLNSRSTDLDHLTGG